jgi:hypothetical protein
MESVAQPKEDSMLTTFFNEDDDCLYTFDLARLSGKTSLPKGYKFEEEIDFLSGYGFRLPDWSYFAYIRGDGADEDAFAALMERSAGKTIDRFFEELVRLRESIETRPIAPPQPAPTEAAEGVLRQLMASKGILADKEWFTVRDVALATDKTEEHVRNKWCALGRIECRKEADRSWRVSRAGFEEYLNCGLRPIGTYRVK